ncbi:MAG TPA: patatin-like phospholipase family protein [Candidatus Angelobacter sp.]|jgi:NTE family protein|nr:patatin-like phospholipase family protein [Candidatus Angelobacter sp.]
MPSTSSSAYSGLPPDPTGGKRALVLSGGGVTGLTYEIGALRALDDLLVGASVNDFDIFVGTSAGSIVGALLANGISPTAMALGVEGANADLSPPSAWALYKPNLSEFAGRLLRLPGLAREVVGDLIRSPLRLSAFDLMGLIFPLIPSGLFDHSELIRYIHDVLSLPGLSDDFRELDKELHIVATALDANERVVFSPFNNPHVPISRAAAASSAIPMLFKPVRIDGIDYVDGGLKGNAAIDVAVDRGATLVVVINPIVPLDSRHMNVPASMRQQVGSRLTDLGMRGVYNQVFRGILHDGLIDHVRLVRNRRPDVDILLIEPRPDDEKMFFHELMSFSARLMTLQHGYESVSTGLYDTWGYLRRILPKHGVRITRRVIDRKPQQVPVESVDSTGVLQRLLRQTVFDRRSRARQLGEDEPALRVNEREAV